MLILNYIKTDRFKRYRLDMLVCVCLGVYFFLIAEHAKPFNRQFMLSDTTIQHPFSVKERVTGINCILLALIVPSFVILTTTLLKCNWNIFKNEQFFLIQNSLLGLCLALTCTGVVTDILKNWVARPRPDFLERCGASPDTPTDILVGIEVCTAPLGPNLLVDGMRSTPSGHSSISFCAFGFLTLWLFGQLKAVHRSRPIYKLIIAISPLILASYIALSRTQDYRHHFIDIELGGLLGSVFTIIVYHHYFPKMWDNASDTPYFAEDKMILPSHISP